MHGEYEQTLAPRIFLAVILAAALAVTGWLLLGGGLEALRALWRLNWALASPGRRWLLFGAAFIYFLRVLVTCFYLLKRKMGWGEAILISVWIAIIDLLFAWLGGTNPRGVGLVALLGAVLYVIGSFLNTSSEVQRKKWKECLANRGHVFTGGLFRYAMHINYFGDEVLFTGYALCTGRAWALLIPLLMLASFVFLSIPDLDRHLHAHYGDEFEAYSRQTRRLIPFLY